MKHWLTGCIFLLVIAFPAQAEKPNVLLICVDDLKPLLGCYGNKTVKSPNIDRLAKCSLLFTNAYCNQAVCSPSRNALLTGLRSDTLGIYDLATNFRVSRPEAITLPQYFRNHGYKTEGLGKIFHVGHGNHEDPRSWSVPHFSAKSIGYALEENKAETKEGALFENKSPAGLPRGAAYESAPVEDTAYGDGKLAEEAARRLKSSPSQPFFMAVGFLKPHLPFCAPKKYWDLYDPKEFSLAAIKTPPKGAPDFAPQFGGELRNYKNMPPSGPIPEETQRKLIHGYHAATSYMDAQLGKVLDALDQTGLAKNTIIVLWGDHGWHLGDHGIWCKHTNFEQATRIPLLISAPGVSGKNSSMVESVDIYPTLAQLAGLPVLKGLDGASLAPLFDDAMAKGKDHIFHVYPRGNRLGRAVRTSTHRLVEWKSWNGSEPVVYELYDYVNDPLEEQNLAASQPGLVEKLKAILAERPAAKPPVENKGKQKAKAGKE